jgi:hypothetical protein
MKRVLVIVMAILMVATLFACQTNVDTQPSSTPETSTAASPETSTAASPEESTAVTTGDNQQAQTSITEKSMVDFEYTADPFARDTYKIAYIMGVHVGVYLGDGGMFYTVGEKLNYDFSSFEAAGDNDKFLNLTETAAGHGYDG